MDHKELGWKFVNWNHEARTAEISRYRILMHKTDKICLHLCPKVTKICSKNVEICC
jgi:hypothetical protein